MSNNNYENGDLNNNNYQVNNDEENVEEDINNFGNNNGESLENKFQRLKNKFPTLTGQDKKFLNKLFRKGDFEPDDLDEILEKKSTKIRFFFKWMKELGWIKRKNGRWVYDVENNNNNNNNNGNNDNRSRNRQNKNRKRNVSDNRNMIVEKYFENKNAYPLIEYENIMNIAEKLKNIDNKNKNSFIKNELAKLGRKNNGVKNMSLNSKDFIIFDPFDKYKMLKKVTNVEISDSYINNILDMCAFSAIEKFYKYFCNRLDDTYYFRIDGGEDEVREKLDKCSKKVVIMYLDKYHAFLYYHRGTVYILNYMDSDIDGVKKFLIKFVKNKYIKVLDFVECTPKVKERLGCLCMNYYMFMSLLNRHIKIGSLHKIVKNIEEELENFIIYLMETVYKSSFD